MADEAWKVGDECVINDQTMKIEAIDGTTAKTTWIYKGKKQNEEFALTSLKRPPKPARPTMVNLGTRPR